MTDIKLIVKIDANVYTRLFDNGIQDDEIAIDDICEMVKELARAVRLGKPIPQCKDCKHFETDAFATIDGIQLIVGHEVCTKWGAGCKTKEDGYCFMFETKEVEE